MAFAPHYNDHVRADPMLPMILGQFRHAETDATFEFAERRHPDDSFAPDMVQMLYCADGSTRLCRVLKTVAYVVIDEDADGPVIEKWSIKGHRAYLTDWVRA